MVLKSTPVGLYVLTELPVPKAVPSPTNVIPRLPGAVVVPMYLFASPVAPCTVGSERAKNTRRSTLDDQTVRNEIFDVVVKAASCL